MLRISLIVISLLFASRCLGQETFRTRLQQSDSLSSARVQVVEHGSAATAVARLRAASKESTVSGYRIRIFWDNSQTARGRAVDVRNRFTEAFPGVAVYMSYQNPYWEVSVGNCATNEEAIMLKGRIESSFSNATIALEKIPIQKFVD